MPLVSMKAMLADAREGKYAVCYCESWNLESLQAVVEAAEKRAANAGACLPASGKLDLPR